MHVYTMRRKKFIREEWGIVWNPYLGTKMEIAQQNGRLRYGQQQN